MGWNSTIVDNKMSTKDLRDFVIDEFYYDINIVYRSNRGNNIYLAYTHKLYPDQIGGCCVKVQQWKHHGYWEAESKDISLNPYDCPDCPQENHSLPGTCSKRGRKTGLGEALGEATNVESITGR